MIEDRSAQNLCKISEVYGFTMSYLMTEDELATDGNLQLLQGHCNFQD